MRVISVFFLISAVLWSVHAATPDQHLVHAMDLIDAGETESAMDHVRVAINTISAFNLAISDEVIEVIEKRIEGKDGLELAAYLIVRSMPSMSSPETVHDATGYIEQSLALDPSLPEAHNTMAVIILGGLRAVEDIAEARTIATRAMPFLNTAIELRPTYIDALQNRAYTHRILGDNDAAVHDSMDSQKAIYGIE